MDRERAKVLLDSLTNLLEEDLPKETPLVPLRGTFNKHYINGYFFIESNSCSITFSSRSLYFSITLSIGELEQLERAIHKAKVEWYSHFTEQTPCEATNR